MTARESPPAAAARRECRQSGRLDNFVDGAFAFAITLLVISGASLPRTVDALMEALRGVPAFAACFAQLAWFWHGHVRWRETVVLTDRTGLLLSLLLVFFALIFVFPLYLVWASFFHSVSGGLLSPDFHPTGGTDVYGMKLLFACFGLSFACMGGTLSALFLHGTRALHGLPPDEAVAVRVHAGVWAYAALVGLVSMLVALSAGRHGAVVAVSGFLYALLALSGVVAGWCRKRARARLFS